MVIRYRQQYISPGSIIVNGGVIAAVSNTIFIPADLLSHCRSHCRISFIFLSHYCSGIMQQASALRKEVFSPKSTSIDTVTAHRKHFSPCGYPL